MYSFSNNSNIENPIFVVMEFTLATKFLFWTTALSSFMFSQGGQVLARLFPPYDYHMVFEA